ncbi:MAG: LacI family DNA-binding transcriptional regulator [Christensenellales bacterium]|jgi:DNA-binding LacI/PurR family transcriptional regulator
MKNSNKNATIYDIAKLANVSATTVSRALNHSGYVSQEKLDEILKIAKELNYAPNQVARMLKSQRTNQIMLSIPDMRNSFYNDFIEAVNKRAEENNYSLLLNYNQMKEKTKHKMLDDLAENHFDGLILVSIHLNETLISKINAIKKPVVLTSISSQPPIQWRGNYDFVGVDTRAAMYMAVKHLIENGHKRIAYIGLDETSLTGKERLEGYTIALREANIPLKTDIVFEGGYDAKFGYESTMAILQSKDRPTAICACNDVLVIGIYKALEEVGIGIPEQMAVVGMDDSEVCRIIRPKLSSISLCSFEIGDAAARLIFERLKDRKKRYENVLFEPKLMARASSEVTL